MDAHRNFGFLLKDASRLYVQRFEQRARAFGLTLPQCKALVHLARHEGISQTTLSELTDLEPMNLVRILDRMEEEGWVERRVDPGDRRARCLHLTPKAKPLVDQIWQLADLTRAEAFGDLSRQQTEALVEMLSLVHANLGRLEPIGTTPAGTVLPARRTATPAGGQRARRPR